MTNRIHIAGHTDVAFGPTALNIHVNRKEETMRTKTLSATLIGAVLITGPATAQSVGIGNAVHGPDNQVIVGGKVVGKDPDPNVRLEIWRRTESMGGG